MPKCQLPESLQTDPRKEEPRASARTVLSVEQARRRQRHSHTGTACAAATLLSSILLATVIGCTQRPLTWNERTIEHDHTFLVDGRTDRQLVYRDVGNPDADTTLLFIHGLLGSKVQWIYVAPEFRDDCRIVMVDLLGHGGSSKPVDCDYSTSMQAGMLRKLIVELDLRDIVLVGASYGGGTAMELAYDLGRSGDRDRLGGVVVIGATGLRFEPSPEHAFVTSPFWRNLVGTFISGKTLSRRALEGCYHDDDAISDELLLDHAVRLDDPRVRRVGGIAGAQIFTELNARAASEDRYKSIEYPVLILWGTHDIVVQPEVFARLHAMLPHSSIVEIKDCGHTPMFERPGATAAHIRRFLQELNTGR